MTYAIMKLERMSNMDKLIEQVILQFPVVLILLYNNFQQDKRFSELLETLLDCLNPQKNEKDPHTYTYPE